MRLLHLCHSSLTPEHSLAHRTANSTRDRGRLSAAIVRPGPPRARLTAGCGLLPPLGRVPAARADQAIARRLARARSPWRALAWDRRSLPAARRVAPPDAGRAGSPDSPCRSAVPSSSRTRPGAPCRRRRGRAADRRCGRAPSRRERRAVEGLDLDRPGRAAAETARAAANPDGTPPPVDHRRDRLVDLDRHVAHARGKRGGRQAIRGRTGAGAADGTAISLKRRALACAARRRAAAGATFHRHDVPSAGTRPGIAWCEAAEDEVGQHLADHVAGRDRRRGVRR